MTDSDYRPGSQTTSGVEQPTARTGAPIFAQDHVLPNGPAAAALVAAGLGCLAMGVLTCLAAWNEAINDALTLYAPVGPLSGKSTGAVLVWLVAWAGLHALWRPRVLNFGSVFMAVLVLMVLGLLGTFPPFTNLTTSWLAH
jgi:hypothetical protein